MQTGENLQFHVGINRYIMECKYVCSRGYCYIVQVELIDTLWNVNRAIAPRKPSEKIELIDTLWNVNLFSKAKYEEGRYELIDTLWNVKNTTSNIFISQCM